jgi:hypothetical protein
MARNGTHEKLDMILFLLASLALYFTPRGKKGVVHFSAVLVVFFSIIMPLLQNLELFFCGAMGIFFALILGIKNGLFTSEKNSYYFCNYGLLTVFVALYLSGQTLMLNQLVLLGVVLLLFSESYTFLIDATESHQYIALATVATTLITMELVWITALLPLSFFAAATVVSLTAFVVHDVLVVHFHGLLDGKTLFNNIAVMSALSLLMAIILNGMKL